MLKSLLEHPYTRGLLPDDPQTTILRQRIVREKGFLRKLYGEWYDWLVAQIPEFPGNVIELGSGGGYLKNFLPDCITSEVFWCPNVDLVLNGRSLPFASQSLRAILMLDVFHHIPNIAEFLSEAERALKPGGIVAMIEPWVTPWSKFIYRHFHPEPFEPDSSDWRFPSLGPLSGANGALPWIVFSRDRDIYESLFPGLRVERIITDNPFSYLASGGISLRSLCPSWSFDLFRRLEHKCSSCMEFIAMFARIVLLRA